jgi:hypothetical protein
VRHFADTFTLAKDPQLLAAQQISDFEEFGHLREADPLFVCLFSARTLWLRGAEAAAFVCEPRVQGPLRWLFEFLIAKECAPLCEWVTPEFLILFDVAHWQGLDAERQARLVYHELRHIQPKVDEYGVVKRNKDDGKPELRLVHHDVEVFNDEILRYGPLVVGLEETAKAIVQGHEAAQARAARGLERGDGLPADDAADRVRGRLPGRTRGGQAARRRDAGVEDRE